MLGCAQTGTGKTCAFATPILQRLNADVVVGPRYIRSLILTPTRELALQIQESFAAYGRNLPLRSAVIFGGVGQQPQVDKLKKGVDILVATPGRLLDLQGQGLLDLSRVEIFVLDEADRMLDMGFIHDVRRVLKLLPEKKQTLFFSATMPPEVMELVDALLHDPAKVEVDPVSSPVEVIDQKVCFVDKGNKSKLLAWLMDILHVKNALVFTRTKHGANKVAADLNKAGISAAAIHGNKSQTAAPTPAPAPAPKKKREPRWKKAEGPSVLDAVLPERSAGPQREEYHDFHRPDPLSSDRIMDATARLLAPRKPAAKPEPVKAEEGESRSRRRKKKKKGGENAVPQSQAERKVREAQPPKAAPAPKAQSKRRHDRGHGPRGGRPMMPMKSGAVKDSTEQPSLMKPYYIEHD